MTDRGAAEPAVVPDTPARQSPVSVSHADRVPALAWLIAGLLVTLELAVSARYGFQQDELYFIVAAHHLAFGYLDQPPLAPLLTRVTGLFGVSPTAIRVVPALFGGAVVVAAARLAALFGPGGPAACSPRSSLRAPRCRSPLCTLPTPRRST